MSLTNLQRHWLYVSHRLGLDVKIPFTLQLNAARTVSAEVLLEGYGAPRGMLIVSDYEVFAGAKADLIEAGYGFSCMSQPCESEINSLEGVEELMVDWGRVATT